MTFYLFLLCGFAGGLLGGMGMGGGTLLIPLLTLLCGVAQGAAQGVSLISFLPMSAIALTVHAKGGRLKREGLAFVCVPALLFSGGSALLAARLPGVLLRRGFGLFLILLSIFPLVRSLRRNENK